MVLLNELVKLHHRNSNPSEVLGCRGAGKSTFINKLFRLKQIDEKAETGTQETTLKTTFYDVTSKVDSLPDRYNKVFIVDQPGIGGLKITEANYLAKFGPG